MSESQIKQAIEEGSLQCPTCKKPIKQFDKYVESCAQVWDGAGDSGMETSGAKVTLICGNDACDWRERTEYWKAYLN